MSELKVIIPTKWAQGRIYKTVILPVIFYDCETWTLTLREEHRLRVFENKVLRKIFGAKRDEVTEEWRKIHNTELHTLSSSPDIIRNIKSRRLRWAGYVARTGESRNAHRVLVGRPEGKRPLGRPRRRWEDNIKMDLREVGYDDRDWINLAQERDQWRGYVMAAMNLRNAWNIVSKNSRYLQRLVNSMPTRLQDDRASDASSILFLHPLTADATPNPDLIPNLPPPSLSLNPPLSVPISNYKVPEIARTPRVYFDAGLNCVIYGSIFKRRGTSLSWMRIVAGKAGAGQEENEDKVKQNGGQNENLTLLTRGREATVLLLLVGFGPAEERDSHLSAIYTPHTHLHCVPCFMAARDPTHSQLFSNAAAAGATAMVGICSKVMLVLDMTRVPHCKMNSPKDETGQRPNRKTDDDDDDDDDDDVDEDDEHYS
ncbi:hypothetical protein ANN_01599 [Periplaneta americana]|uniref:Uncharacterized protein n=1 Tax=Periplaneta americana TaxID=6978 RepID=A0ABQ8TU00_PERAM|nr:hypothetical protein ANN_01599 [Periplaneta americana]